MCIHIHMYICLWINLFDSNKDMFDRVSNIIKDYKEVHKQTLELATSIHNGYIIFLWSSNKKK